ncbi:histone-lysine N-methyltransferase SETMAR [Trichonephila clavipes]|nr:histone-lysine N-methyltransferase SETMAR [Trichonephila clavipes]
MKCVYAWLTRFREERESVFDNHRSKRSVTSFSDKRTEKPISSKTGPGKKKVGEQIEHPPFSPDLNPPDFFPFPRIKLALKGKIFDDISVIQRNATRLLNSISKEDFLRNFQGMCSRSQGCIVMGGDYSEGQ